MNIDVLTKEEYEKHKNPFYDLIKPIEENLKNKLEEDLKILEHYDGIIDLKYDENGNAIFTKLFPSEYPKTGMR